MKHTAKYLLEVLEDQLSQKKVDKFTMADLIRSSGVKRGTIYYHFSDLNDVYDTYIENLLSKQTMNSLDEQINELVNFIYSEKTLCLNLYKLTWTKLRRTHLLNILNKSFQQYGLCNEEQGSYLVGGFLFILVDWFDNDLRDSNEEVSRKLLSYIEFIKEKNLVK